MSAHRDMRITGVDALAAPSATAARNHTNSRDTKHKTRDRHHSSVAHDSNFRTAILSVQGPGIAHAAQVRA